VNPLRILHVVQRYWPYTGGSERHLQEISERLVREGHEVVVYTSDAWDLELFWNRDKARVQAREEAHSGVRIRRFPVKHLPGPPLAFPAVRRLTLEASRLPFVDVSLLFRLSHLAPRVPSLVRELETTGERFDVVHAMNICFEGLGVAAQRYARRHNAGFMCTPLTHLGEPGDDSVRRYYTMRHQSWLERESDAVLAQTLLERRHLLGQGVQESKITVVGVGVNPADVAGGCGERFRQSYSVTEPIVAFIGATAFDKGTHHLVEAMRRLWRRGAGATLVIAGPTMDQFTSYYDTLSAGEKRRCRLLGFIPEQDKRDLLDAASLLAMPSRTDSFGIVYLEAWLYGKPVIGADAGGVPDVISDGQDGYLVPFGGVTELEARISDLLADEAHAAAMGERGRQKVLDRYTWDRLYPRVQEVYERLWKQKRV
jgi:glycosyltransferase involved in cell wall biosynthesis